MKNINGIHHITAIAGSPQKNIDFYVKVLGLKFIKKTVNFDDPYTYHLYYGDETGNPGTILTFFPWTEQGFYGKKGTGQIAAISFSVPSFSLDYWMNRLKKYNIEFAGPSKRFEEEVLIFEDYDGFEIEIVANEEEKRGGYKSVDVPPEHSIRGFWGATIWHKNIKATEELLTDLLDFKKLKEMENRVRFFSGDEGPGSYLDLLQIPEQAKGIMGVGAIHHIAFRTNDEADQLKMRERLISKNYNVTPVIDRNYFKSIYFHEPGNVLFEIATDPPGFFVDEKTDSLSLSLKLPPWLESSRSQIEAVLPPIKLPE